ncbi:LOW QUALITY PROTEIN: uncharacterized protein [Macrobrachium rosenbergii]|uniref:LOW QUALITY PROTEIN: uncharacterized protein n=1 Tax=Macrobrachium rosenbergii TaxID=79674 RepID=UPI0034D53D08
MILNGTLTSRKNSQEREPSESRADSGKMPETKLSSEPRSRKKSAGQNVPVASAPKTQELTELPRKEKNVRASRSRGKNDQTASGIPTVQAKKSDTSSKENAEPKEPAVVAAKILSKHGSPATRLTPSRPDANNMKQNRRSGNSCVAKKPPIWVAGSGTPADSRRQSIRRKSHLYDFSASPVKGRNKKPKRQYRPRVRTKDTRQKCKLKSVLVTDPEWENPLAAPSGEPRAHHSAVEPGESPSGVTTTENIFDAEFYAQMNSAVSEDYASDDDVCERDDGCVFEMFEGETASSFVPSREMESLTVPMVSVSGHPTPAVRKQIDKHLGSSTPRAETLSFSSPEQPVTVQDDIAQCFGFENDVDDHSSLNLSPVRQSGQQSQLHLLTFNSEITTSINYSTSQPYRFSWGVMRPGNRSYSSSRSSSMVVHGRSTNVSASLSNASVGSHQNVTRPLQNSKDGTTTTKVKAQGRHRLALQRSSQGNPRVRGRVAITSSSSQGGKHDVSALFDEEEEDENTESCAPVNEVAPVQRSSPDIQSYLSDNRGRVSPQKSVTKCPRRSYNRQALLEAKKKLEKEYGGAATTEAETDEDVSAQKEPPKRKKKVIRKKVSKKQKTASNDETMEESQTSEGAVPGKPGAKKRRGPKKKDNRLERSIQDWASSLNSHFSEIEDSELVVL